MKLVVALGNPGSKYAQTRHNIGWLLLDHFKALDTAIWKSKFKGVYADLSIGGEKVVFLKPETFMNLSGESVRPLMDFFKIDVDDMIVVYDEIDLKYGQVHFKKGGGLAGHNGLKSIVQHIGSDAFYRLRLGVGRPEHGSVSNWVLSGFHGDDGIALDGYLNKAAEALELFLTKGYSKAINNYNKKMLIEEVK